MAFTVHLKPHHVKHPTKGWIKGGPPQPEKGFLYHLEIDCSTGLEGWTRLTDAEVAEREAAARDADEQRAEDQRRRDADLSLLREHANDDPHFAALLRHLGIDMVEPEP